MDAISSKRALPKPDKSKSMAADSAMLSMYLSPYEFLFLGDFFSFV